MPLVVNQGFYAPEMEPIDSVSVVAVDPVPVRVAEIHFGAAFDVPKASQCVDAPMVDGDGEMVSLKRMKELGREGVERERQRARLLT